MKESITWVEVIYDRNTELAINPPEYRKNGYLVLAETGDVYWLTSDDIGEWFDDQSVVAYSYMPSGYLSSKT